MMCSNKLKLCSAHYILESGREGLSMGAVQHQVMLHSTQCKQGGILLSQMAKYAWSAMSLQIQLAIQLDAIIYVRVHSGLQEVLHFFANSS